MIIKNIKLENFLCYFGVKEFELSDGLNIILGDNGEGKTKFFEAIDWLFNDNITSLKLLASAKALKEVDESNSFTVGVSMTVEQHGEIKTIKRSFLVTKNKNSSSVSNSKLEGIEENDSGERSPVDGELLLNNIFPYEIRRYSMFKGESQLNIFDNEDALNNLINSFSNAKHYKKYALKGQYLSKKAEDAVSQATKRNNKNKKEYNRLESRIVDLQNQKTNNDVFCNNLEKEISRTEDYISSAEKHVSNAESLQIINGRIRKIEEQKKKLEGKIKENYTTYLFDESWILLGFEKFHHEYSEKISNFSKQKRNLQSSFDVEIGIKEGERREKEKIKNKIIPLPLGVPNKKIMQELIKDEICKVCNREAKKGTPEHEFMKKRLEEYLKSQEPEKKRSVKKEVLFKFNYFKMLDNLCVNHEDNISTIRKIGGEIEDLFEFNESRKKSIEDLENKLSEEINEREKIIGSSSHGADKLSSVLKNYNSWQNDLKEKNKQKIYYEDKSKKIEFELNQVKKEKDEIDTKSANTYLINTRNILRDIENIFIDTKENIYDDFIQQLQDKANEIFSTVNVDDFTGEIIFKKKHIGGKAVIKIELQENGNYFHKPNQALETSMHIAILFAISELASDLREEMYPMIFDAPTSSFGENKTKEFLNLIYETGKQRIILFYDFIGRNKEGKQYLKAEFENVKRDRAYLLQRDRPFDSKDLSTINTLRIPV